MERRWGTRKSIEVEVVIDNQPGGLLHGRIGNVSVGGLFVRTEPAGLAMNTRVELVLMQQHGEGTQVYRMPAMVVRLTPQGAGLRFDEYNVEAFRALVVLLLAHRRAGRRGAEPRYRTPPATVSDEDGDAASLKEGTTDGASAARVAPISPQLSPAFGEPH